MARIKKSLLTLSALAVLLGNTFMSKNANAQNSSYPSESTVSEWYNEMKTTGNEEPLEKLFKDYFYIASGNDFITNKASGYDVIDFFEGEHYLKFNLVGDVGKYNVANSTYVMEKDRWLSTTWAGAIAKSRETNLSGWQDAIFLSEGIPVYEQVIKRDRVTNQIYDITCTVPYPVVTSEHYYVNGTSTENHILLLDYDIIGGKVIQNVNYMPVDAALAIMGYYVTSTSSTHYGDSDIPDDSDNPVTSPDGIRVERPPFTQEDPKQDKPVQQTQPVEVIPHPIDGTFLRTGFSLDISSESRWGLDFYLSGNPDVTSGWGFETAVFPMKYVQKNYTSVNDISSKMEQGMEGHSKLTKVGIADLKMNAYDFVITKTIHNGRIADWYVGVGAEGTNLKEIYNGTEKSETWVLTPEDYKLNYDKVTFDITDKMYNQWIVNPTFEIGVDLGKTGAGRISMSVTPQIFDFENTKYVYEDESFAMGKEGMDKTNIGVVQFNFGFNFNAGKAERRKNKQFETQEYVPVPAPQYTPYNQQNVSVSGNGVSYNYSNTGK
ncbi:MAG: hypothetical protein ACP5N3_03580 [Candidatus Nanoarchaeia archaeon]